MKILTLLSTYPPHTYGGGEASALSLQDWLRRQGHEMGVLTTGGKSDPIFRGDSVDGVKVWRFPCNRPYPYWEHTKAGRLAKVINYLQDHFDPRNKSGLREVIRDFEPDVALVHVIAGIGFNSLRELAKSNIPTVYFMHDLNLVCINGGTFRNSTVCASQCATCSAVSSIRRSSVNSIPRLAYCSPSAANIERAKQFMDFGDRPVIHALNPTYYPRPPEFVAARKPYRITFIGRLSAVKGVHVMLDAIESLPDPNDLTVRIVGGGLEEAPLRSRYGSNSWIKFYGQVTQDKVHETVLDSDLVCVPSIWPENSPGVLIHALSQGVPVFASNIGGLPELVTDSYNGKLIEPGSIDRWRQAFMEIIENPDLLEKWRRNALKDTSRFDQDALGHRVLDIIENIVR